MVTLPSHPVSVPDPMDQPLLYWGQRYWDHPDNAPHRQQPAKMDPDKGEPIDPWTFRDAFEGTQIFGGTGSGKTSGSGRTLALALLTSKLEGRLPFGGLVLCVKPEEVRLWTHPGDPSRRIAPGYAALAGRRDDLIVLGPPERTEVYTREWGLDVPPNGHRFDFLRFMQGRTGGRFTHNMVHLFFTALEAGQDKQQGATDPYWDEALRQLLTNAIDLAEMATGTVTLADMTEIIISAPEGRDAVRGAIESRRGRCCEYLWKADERLRSQPSRHRDFIQTANFWLNDFANLAERTRSIVVNSFTSKATALLRSPMYEMFCSGESTVTPEDSRRGKIIVLDLSVKDFGETGRFAQLLFKTVWQRALEQTDMLEQPHPVFLWADEAQYFVTREDMVFQQTARSKRVATVYLTQNVSNYYAALGKHNSEAVTHSLLGNFQTKVFHSNADPVTNEWAERLGGHEMKETSSDSMDSKGASVGRSESWLPAIPASTFFRLRKGGPPFWVAEAVVFCSGRPWDRPLMAKNPARPAAKVHFNQMLMRRNP